MAKKPREYDETAKLRTALIAELGGRCAICGTTENLRFHEFEYPYGKAKSGRARAQRVQRLIREGRTNAVTVMCRRCHRQWHKENQPYA